MPPNFTAEPNLILINFHKMFNIKPKAIRNALRQDTADPMDRRRKILALSSLGLIDFSIISMYQTGIIESLPDIDHELFDSDGVNASEDAYQFGVPDGVISAFNYTSTMLLAAAGGNEKSGRGKIWDYLLVGSVLTNAGGALYYLGNMIFKQKKACLYCLAGAAINLAMVPLAVKNLQEK